MRTHVCDQTLAIKLLRSNSCDCPIVDWQFFIRTLRRRRTHSWWANPSLESRTLHLQISSRDPSPRLFRSRIVPLPEWSLPKSHVFPQRFSTTPRPVVGAARDEPGRRGLPLLSRLAPEDRELHGARAAAGAEPDLRVSRCWHRVPVVRAVSEEASSPPRRGPAC